MARIAGVDLPREKRVEIGLTYIYGIGRTRSNKVVIFVPNEKNKIGDIVNVKILEARKWYLKGEIV